MRNFPSRCVFLALTCDFWDRLLVEKRLSLPSPTLSAPSSQQSGGRREFGAGRVACQGDPRQRYLTTLQLWPSRKLEVGDRRETGDAGTAREERRPKLKPDLQTSLTLGLRSETV